MTEQLSLENKHRLLKKALSNNLHKREQIELKIREKLEELKKVETLLEKTCLNWNKLELLQDYM